MPPWKAAAKASTCGLTGHSRKKGAQPGCTEAWPRACKACFGLNEAGGGGADVVVDDAAVVALRCVEDRGR